MKDKTDTISEEEVKPEDKVLKRGEILNADDLKTEKVYVPQWKGCVYVRTMTGTERDQYEESIFDIDERKRKADNIRSKLLVQCIVDEKGEKLFNEFDIKELGKKSAQALSHLFSVASRLNGMSRSDIEELERD